MSKEDHIAQALLASVLIGSAVISVYLVNKKYLPWLEKKLKAKEATS